MIVAVEDFVEAVIVWAEFWDLVLWLRRRCPTYNRGRHPRSSFEALVPAVSQNGSITGPPGLLEQILVGAVSEFSTTTPEVSRPPLPGSRTPSASGIAAGSV